MKFGGQNRGRDSSGLNLWRNERGLAAVEFAMMATVLLFLLMLATDIGLAIKTQMEVGNAARAGAQFAAINGFDSQNISVAATSATSLTPTVQASTYCGCASAGGIVTQICGTICSSSGIYAGTYVTVNATATYMPIFKALWSSMITNNALNMRATAVTRIN
jgi:Flp pilus assembly protein TadG